MQVQGHLQGLKKGELAQLHRIFRRHVPRNEVISWELLRYICGLSHALERRVAVLIDRKGEVAQVLVGTHHSFPLRPHSAQRLGATRLSGYRRIDTTLDDHGLERADLNDLERNRLDAIAVVGVTAKGEPGLFHLAHLASEKGGKEGIRKIEPVESVDLNLEFDTFIAAIEEEFARQAPTARATSHETRAILCALVLPTTVLLEETLEETRELARTSGMTVAETIIQKRDQPDSKFFFGRGKLDELVTIAQRLGTDLLLFHQNLSPNQARLISDETQLRVIDRTQLILDIFAQRAKSHDGKLQVELAQLRYTIPRLRERATQMSRLVGGIGGRGPGETKLEIHRRRARERVTRLEREIERIGEKRATKRALRSRKNLPIVSIVGYTNAGKSTLLNSLTHAEALAEDKLFATLDPFSKRLRFPRDREIILTDTVGFIRDLPEDLIAAFRATLEEIGEADLLLHIVDIATEGYRDRMRIVLGILGELGYDKIPQIVVCNKSDRLSPEVAERIATSLNGIALSAVHPESCRSLLPIIEGRVWASMRATDGLRPL